MNKFELFSMIYYALNNYWKENKSEELTSFLSDMNPFLFDDIGSAVPSVDLGHHLGEHLPCHSKPATAGASPPGAAPGGPGCCGGQPHRQ